MDFDLPNFDSRKGADEGFELQLVDLKTGAPSQVFITVRGADSEAFQAANNEQARRRMRALQKSRKATVMPEQMDADVIELLVAATVGWRGVKAKGGAEVPYSPAAAAELYKAFPTIREQVDQAIGDRSNFLTGNSKSSSSSPATSSN